MCAGGRHGGVPVGGEVLATPVGTDFVDDEGDDEAEDDERCPEDPDWLSDSAAGNVDGVGCAHSAEHDDCVSADRDVLSEVRGAEEVDQVVTDDGITVGADTAEEDNYVVLRLVRNVHVAEEDHYIVVDVTLGVDAAEEADSVMNTVPFGDVDVAAELYVVLFGTSGSRDEQDCRGEQDGREQTLGDTLSHGDPHAELYARAG